MIGGRGMGSAGMSAAAASQLLTSRVTYVDIQSGSTLYSTFTLDGFLALWANTVIANPANAGADPVQTANGAATNYCATHPGVDCSQQGYLVAAYGGWVAAYLAGSPLPPLPGAPYTPPGSNVVPNVPTSATPPIPAPPPPINQSTPSAALQALMSAPVSSAPVVVPTPTTTITPAATAPVVVNPSPASTPVTTGSNVASPASVANVANGSALQVATTTGTDLITGIPNDFLFLGAAGVGLVLLMVAMGGK